jgi:hypothetical protein
MRAKTFIVAAAASVSLLGSLGVAAAAAPENRPSTTMDKDGGRSGMDPQVYHGRLPPYVHEGRSVAVRHRHFHHRVR